MSDYPMLISNKLHSFRNFEAQRYYNYTSRLTSPLSFFNRNKSDEQNLLK